MSFVSESGRVNGQSEVVRVKFECSVVGMGCAG